jgi:cytochrome c peroxidase
MQRLSNTLSIVACSLSLCSAAVSGQTPEPATREELVRWLRVEYTKPPAGWPKPTLDAGVAHLELGPPGPVPFPEGMKPTEEKQKLGLSLFFDPRLSGSQQISCARCHDPEHGWADGRSQANGVFMTTLDRNTPGLAGVGHAKSLFWDGRATTLEDQARMVILNPKEMAGNPREIENRLTAEKEFYQPMFQAAFGDPAITFDRVVQSLAAFQRSLRVGNSAFDRFLSGKHDALKDDAVVGLHLFRTQGRCLNCHGGPMFSDDQFHNAGLTYYGRRFEDTGLFAITKKPEDMGKFRTPSLRNVGNTGPWMHNGLFSRLDGVLRLYNAGMPQPKRKENQKDDPLFPVTSHLLKPLSMKPEQLADLEAFLRSLDERPIRLLRQPFPLLGSPPAPDVPVPAKDGGDPMDLSGGRQ